MYKSNTELIVIDAKATEPIPTKVVFWSHDKGTAKLVFELKKDTIPQSLAEGTKVPILLEFDSATAENGRGKHTYFATIDDAVNGIVSIVLEDNILGYQGRVDGSIYIELPDSRSLDTAGRFTFDIKRSPIDENVPELEDYYWQGFNEIMTQYHETIATIKSEAKTLLDSLTADVTKVKNDIATANIKIAEIRQKLDDNDVFTKAESSANVIYQVIGKDTTKIKGTTNFKFKIAGSLEENPHWAGAANVGEKLENPYYLNTEVTQDRYDSLSEIDDNYISVLANNSNVRAALCLKIDFLETVKQLLGENYFSDLGATSKSQELAILNMIVTNFNVGAYAKGVSNNGGVTNNRVSSKVWFDDLRWTAGTQTNETNSIKRLAHWKDTIYEVSRYLNADGVMQLIVFSDLRDDSNQTGIFVDYFDLNIDLNLSANKHLKSLIAANHVENLATQTEATTATDNTKAMTPLRTKQLLDSKLLNMVYPIGSIYMSVNSATPATLFGGTWERFAKGQVLVGVNEDDAALKTAGTNGGSTNPLTAHTHTTQLTTYRVTSGTGSGSVNNLGRATDLGDKMTGEFGSVTSTGDNTDHKNWQPFTTVYIWKRTA